MYLRVTGFKSTPDKIAAGIQYFEEKILPAMSQLPGFVGASAIVDREKSQGAATTVWESLEAMNKAEQAGIQARLDSEAATGIEVIDVDRFEITILELASAQPQLPSYSRLVTGYGDPAKADQVGEMLRESLPILKQQPGFRAFVAGVNRATGRAFTTSSWDSPEQREASNQAIEASRQKIVERGGLYGLQVDLVETVVAELKVAATA